ncbi:MAG: hypothetical protein ACXVGQ_00225 [Mycobacteriaceae bacterium]
MQIEVITQDEGLSGEREVWVRVLSNTVPDLADIKKAMDADQLAVMASVEAKPSRYYPHLVTPEEREDHGHSLEEWFIFRPLKGVE